MHASPPRLVLIIDGEPDIGALIADVLETEGYIPHVVETGGDALNLLATIRPHLILLSLNVAGLPGEQLLSMFRAMPATTAIPIVALTAHSTIPARVHRQATATLTKPFNLEDLIAVTARALCTNTPQERTIGE